MVKFVGFIALVIIAVAGWFLWNSHTAAPATAPTLPQQTDNMDQQGMDSMSPTGSDSTSTSATSSSATSPATGVTVSYDGSSFSPASVTVKQGDVVTFTDSADSNMWVASDPHPSHTGYDGTSRADHCAAGYSGSTPFDQCKPGSSYSFTFDKVGSWGYHNHLNAGVKGTVNVVAQ